MNAKSATTTKSANVVPKTLTRGQKAVVLGAYLILSGLTRTVRLRFDRECAGAEAVREGPVIFAIWHNRLAISMASYKRFLGKEARHRRIAALVSASRDGAKLAQLLQFFGAQPVRGSSSRRGGQGILELMTWVERGYDIAITPDGPRGPRYQVQRGIVSLAQLTGKPIVPISAFTRAKVCLRSWDRFQIPLPFAKSLVRIGDPVRVPREASDSELEACREQLQADMLAITED